MKYKKGLIVICLIICLFSFAGVSACEKTNETIDLISDANDSQVIESLDLGNDLNDSLGNSINEETDKLCDSPGTFSDLAKEISKANSELNLTMDYKYDDNYDKEFESRGIHVWNSSITINGNGHTIDGNNKSRAFEFFGSNITVKDLKVINGLASNYRYAGAISFRASNCSLINCTFINNRATDTGGAIHLESENQRIINCTFINNSAMRYDGGTCFGGAIGGYPDGSNCIIDNCTFINNTSHYGGAIRWYGGANATVSNCLFINNTALKNDYGGGAIDWVGENGTIIDSCFVNSTFYDIYLMGGNNRIIDCNCSRTNSPVFHRSNIGIIAKDNISFNEPLLLKISVASGATGNIGIYVNDIFKKNISAGDICYLNDLNSGANIIKVVYNANGYYLHSENATKVMVNKVKASITLKNIISDYGRSNSTLAIVKGGIGIKAFIVNHPEAIVNVKHYKITVSGLDVGNYTLMVVVIPDDNHIGVNATAMVTVKKADSSIPDVEVIGKSPKTNATDNVKKHPKVVNLNKGIIVTVPDKNNNATSKIDVNKMKKIISSDRLDSSGVLTTNNGSSNADALNHMESAANVKNDYDFQVFSGNATSDNVVKVASNVAVDKINFFIDFLVQMLLQIGGLLVLMLMLLVVLTNLDKD